MLPHQELTGTVVQFASGSTLALVPAPSAPTASTASSSQLRRWGWAGCRSIGGARLQITNLVSDSRPECLGRLGVIQS